jgi:hypothetical protein
MKCWSLHKNVIKGCIVCKLVSHLFSALDPTARDTGKPGVDAPKAGRGAHQKTSARRGGRRHPLSALIALRSTQLRPVRFAIIEPHGVKPTPINRTKRDRLCLGQLDRRRLYSPSRKGHDWPSRATSWIVGIRSDPTWQKGTRYRHRQAQGAAEGDSRPYEARRNARAFRYRPRHAKGEVDVKQLEAWAMSRGTGETHEFTQILLDAVVEPNAKGSTQ